jgi:hypothetical protein
MLTKFYIEDLKARNPLDRHRHRWNFDIKTGYKYIGLRMSTGFTRGYPKVSGLAAWSENCKW